MAGDEPRLIGVLSNKVPPPYGGQHVYALPDGRYRLEGGRMVLWDVLQQLRGRGLLISEDARGEGTIADLSPLVPDRIDPGAEDGVVFAVDRERPVARVSYFAEVPYEGDLVFRSNLDTHFVTEKGYVLDRACLERLGEAGHMLHPRDVRPRSPWLPAGQAAARVPSSEAFARRQHFARIGFMVLVVVAALGLVFAATNGLLVQDLSRFRDNSLGSANSFRPQVPSKAATASPVATGTATTSPTGAMGGLGAAEAGKLGDAASSLASSGTATGSAPASSAATLTVPATGTP